MESEKLLNDLQSSDKDIVSAAMDTLKQSLHENDGAIMLANIKKLFKGFYNILASHGFDPVIQCTNLLIELLNSDDPDLEIHFLRLVPILVQNLGSTKIPVCSATYNCLKVYCN